MQGRCRPAAEFHSAGGNRPYRKHTEQAVTEFDKDWDDLPVAELHQLDAVCDRFEQALAQDPATRIEAFIANLAEPQQRLLVLELAQLEVEQRHADGQVVTAEEYAERFPQWADDLRSLVQQNLEDADRTSTVAANAETVHQFSFSDTWSGKKKSRAKWADEWRASASEKSRSELPEDGVLGHYHLRSVIGRGGMGLVVRAHDTRLGRDVALKVLASELSHDANAHERFLREAQAVAGIQHENVVRIFGVEDIDGIPFLAMELVDGITLEYYLRDSEEPTPSEVVSFARQIALGLAAAHKQNLVHRDIKPANILLQKIDPQDSRVGPLATWHVKITDFGLARVAATSQLTSPGVIAGTPQYMSPEQANGRELDVRSDLFSLGSVMYTMCAGQAAFSAESAVAILRQVADMPARSLAEVSPETPDWLTAVIEQLMSKSPDNRIQSATEVAEVLGGYEHDLQNGTTPSTSTAPRPIRKGRIAVALLMIAFIGFWMAQIVFRVETPHGTLTVRTDDPDVQISVKSGGTEVALFFPRQNKEIPLKIGEYTIELVEGKDGLKLSTTKFEIRSGQDQRTVTVELEPAVVAAKDLPTVEEQATVTEQTKAGDVQKTFAWPAEALSQGKIAAPDLSQAEELYRHDFAGTWPTAKGAGGEIGREQDTYFIRADPGLVRAAWIDGKTYTNFACEVVGGVQSKGCQWFLGYTSLNNYITLRFHVNGAGGLGVSILNDGPSRTIKLIRHTAQKTGAEFNKLLVVARGNRFELYENGVAICDPIVLNKSITPGRFDLGAVATTIDAVRAEFKSFTVWSTEGLPTPEERLARGAPYNALPAPAKPKPVDTAIAPDPPPAIAR
jgi:serine/threonine protein kinase